MAHLKKFRRIQLALEVAASGEACQSRLHSSPRSAGAIVTSRRRNALDVPMRNSAPCS